MFCELHARSAFSFLRGASQPEALVTRAAELGYPAIALCDHLGFQGSPRAHATARQHGIRAIVGTSLEAKDGTPSVSLLAATRKGYSQLCRELTEQLADTPPATDFLTNTRHSDRTNDLIALTGDREAKLSQLLIHGRKAEAEAFARSLISRFGKGNVYIQLTRHHLRDDARVNRLLIDLASHLKLPLLATNSPLHATRADRLLCDAFTCLRHHTTLDQAGALLAPNGERHLKSPRAMRELFADLPESVDQTLRLADRIEFGLENLGYRFPDVHDPYGFPLSQNEQSTRLRRLTYAGAHRRYGKLRRKVVDQLEHEFRLIHKLGFPGYFLIVHEIMEFAKAHGIFCQGRGSAANSAVCYALGITNVDPVGGGLLFERFLSENRRSWPDIDIDFPSGDRRELVIQHVFEKYAPRGAAMTANVITYRPRSAFREMSKVLGFPTSIADRFSELSRGGGAPSGNPESSGQAHPLLPIFERSGIPAEHPRLPALVQLYESVLTMPRHLGQHSGGMIICDRGLDRIVPLQPATMPGRTIVQWDKDDCEDLGIVKVDLLGLGMLAAIEDALHLCAGRGHSVDPATIPKDDPAVFEMLCRADTIGTFQVESRAQMATLPIMRPQTFYDLAIEVAIIRPGPIVGDLVHPYLNRRNGREPVDLIHPDLEPILKRTLGVPLFQEQVLRMAMTLADFTGAEADELRRAMAFKRADEKMEKVARKLSHRMTAKGIPLHTQEKVIRSIGSFALYGFPESHAISFALIAYLSCWLKVHHPAEFYCGLINNQPMGFYSVNTLLQDAKRHRVRARPVSVVQSGLRTTVIDDHHLRLGFHRIKGLRTDTAERIVDARDRQDFTSLADFLHRVHPSDRERRILAASGALNPLPGIAHRRDALWQSELPLHDDLWSSGCGFQPQAVSAASSRSLPAEEPAPQASTDATPLGVMSDTERLATDLSLTGSSTGPHPMALWRSSFQAASQPTGPRDSSRAPEPRPVQARLDSFGSSPNHSLTADRLGGLRHGSPLSIAGMVICRQRPSTAKGHCFISLEDETGIANLFVPRDTFHQHKFLITTEPFLLCHGRLQISEGNQPTVYVTSLEPLPGSEQTTSAPSHDFH